MYDFLLARHCIRTDAVRTDGTAISISGVSMLTRDKNDFTFWLIFGLSPNLGLSERLIQEVK